MPIDITIDEGLAFVSLNIYFYGYICWESDGRGKSLMDHLSSLPLPGFPCIKREVGQQISSTR